MGGDGGVVATDRRYMRGAGSACHTADSKRASKSAIAEAEREAQAQIMATCAITGSLLDMKDIVACPFGRLYVREAAVLSLLRRVEGGNNRGDAESEKQSADLGWHVRGLKDLHPVRFHLSKKVVNNEEVDVPICPVTSIELNGIQPAFLVVKTKLKKKDQGQDDSGPNVLSEKAIKEMGLEMLQEEYGPFDEEDLIRLAPPSKSLDEIKVKIQQKRLTEKAAKSSKKKRKKEVRSKGSGAVKKICGIPHDPSSTHTSAKKPKVNPPQKQPQTVDDVRSNVAAAVASSKTLSNLFADHQSNLTEKQKKDSLFASNC